MQAALSELRRDGHMGEAAKLAVDFSERQRLVAVVKGRADRRSREIRLTDTGAERLRTAVEGWVKAQARFEAVFGEQRSSELRALLHAVSASELEGARARG